MTYDSDLIFWHVKKPSRWVRRVWQIVGILLAFIALVLLAQLIGPAQLESQRQRARQQQEARSEAEWRRRVELSDKLDKYWEEYRKLSPEEQERRDQENAKELAKELGKELGVEPCTLLDAGCGATIPYTPGQPILVDVRLNGHMSARLLLDTGADSTLISPRALGAAGARRPVARGEMRGVTGSATVLSVMLDSIEVGGARVERLPVVAYEMGERESDGLLGRDFLDRFTITIDPSRGVVTLSPK